MRYRIIIADDEKKIIQLIKQLGHWDEFGIEIIDECHDGKEALNSILKNKPDFVLSDIKMPEYDGIQLIEKTRVQNLNTLFILLSGYRHFEYARSAIQLNVVDYLLKPIDEKQLNETLEKVCKRLDQIHDQKVNHEKLAEYEAAHEQSRLEDFWKIFMQKNREQGRKAIRTESECNEIYHTEFIHNCYQIVYVDTNLDAMLTMDNSLFSEKVGNYINNSFKEMAYVIYYTNYVGHVIILNFEENKKSEIRNAILALFYNIRDLNEVYGNFRINIGCSKLKNSCSKLIEAYEEALVAEWGRLIFFGNKILDYDQIVGLQHFDPKTIINSTEEKEIQNCITYMRVEELSQLFASIYNRAAAYNNSSSQDMIIAFYRLQDIILNCFSDQEQKERKKEYYFAYQEAKNFQQIFKNIYLKLEKYLTDEQKKLKEKIAKPIEEAIRYLKKNYGNQISLEEVAAFSNVSASYLSRLFKEEMKVGFAEYLTQIRLDESKKMLSDTNLSVKEIALKVGYADEKYYSKLFKKITGIRPTDYRRLYG